MSLLWNVGVAALLAVLWTASEAVRRLYFHPLAHIPGPRLAALTWWYEFYFDVIRPGQYVFKIQELHTRYGPIIRITPDEVHVNDVGFLDTIYAPSMIRRDKYGYQLRSLRVPGGLGTTTDHDLHKVRRESLTPFFSKKNIQYMEGLITDKVDQLKQLISTHVARDTPVNLSDVFFAFSNDVVNNFLFAHRTDVLASEPKAATLRQNSKELLMGININKHFPQIPDFLESLPMSISRPVMPPGLIDLLALFDRVREEIFMIKKDKESSVAHKKNIGPTGKASVFDSLVDNPNLPASEKTLLRLQQEGALLVLAGTESPAQTLNIIFYHLLANPALLEKLRRELRAVPVPSSWTIGFLSASRLASTPVCTTTLSAHTADTVFPDPFVFDPERWLGDAGKERRRFQMAFNKGGRRCLGIELARAELYHVVAALVREFDMALFETDADDVAFMYDYQVAMPKMGSKGTMLPIPPTRVAKQFFTHLPYYLQLRASKILISSFFVWLLIFYYCRVTLWRDPHSAYFQDRHVYELDYSLHREREAWHFISQHNSGIDPPDYVKSGSTPSVCIAMVTVRRDSDHYFEASVGSLLEGLDERERQALYLSILFADTDPRVHPSWDQKWVGRLVDSADSYNVTEGQLQHLQDLEKEKNFYEKGVFDYIYALRACQEVNAPYTIIFEDDIIVATGWFSKTLKALSDISQRNQQPRNSWIYLRLFYTETSLGWSDSDMAYTNMTLIFGLLMLSTFSSLSMLRHTRFQRLHLDTLSIVVISMICVPAFTALVYMAGKYNVMPLHGVVEMNQYGCCTQGLVFPRESVDGLIEFLSARGHGQTDSMIEEYADQSQLTRYALAPPQLQHVGLKSSRNNLDINTQSTWAFWFETNDPANLRREHATLLEDDDVERMLNV
ncbi:CAZyme family GT109 [Aspergillus niger]|nr:CAZyme family GT109 [Aspergillus niger]